MQTISEDPTLKDKPGGHGHEYILKAGAVLEQYKILRPLGAGGMGEVYLVENVLTHKRYALKVLPPALAKDPQFAGRFRVEARVMADLDHPNIVRVHHMGESHGLYYLTMDYIGPEDGEPSTLDDLLMDEGGSLPARGGSAFGGKPEKVREIALQICAALEYAHGKGIVHRDLKPSNILIQQQPSSIQHPASRIPHPESRILICDFGLAKVLGQPYLSSIIERSVSLSIGDQVSIGDMKTRDRPRYEKTSTRSILGTYDYMSPEQKVGGEITPRSDIYSFGMMLYRMLTGRKAEGAYRPPSRFGFSRGWDSIIEKCIQQDPPDRFASITTLRRDLEQVGRGRRTRRILSLVATLALLSGFTAGTWWWAQHRPTGPTHPTSPTQPASPSPPETRGPPSTPAVSVEPIEQPPPGQQPAVRLADVAPFKSRAEQAWIQVERLDRGQRFGPDIDESETLLREADILFQGAEYAAAKGKYQEVMEACDGLIRREAERQQSITARINAEEARDKASHEKADQEAHDIWTVATNLMAKASKAFEEAMFPEAQTNWEAGASKFAEAGRIAHQVVEQRAERTAAVEALRAAEAEKSARDAARQAADKARKEAEASRTDETERPQRQAVAALREAEASRTDETERLQRQAVAAQRTAEAARTEQDVVPQKARSQRPVAVRPRP